MVVKMFNIGYIIDYFSILNSSISHTDRSVIRAVRIRDTSSIHLSISRGPLAIAVGALAAGVAGAFSLSRSRICSTAGEDCSPVGSSRRLIPNSVKDFGITRDWLGDRSQGECGIVT